MDICQKKRLRLVVLIVGGGLLLLIAYALFYHAFGFGIPCAFHVLTGLDCAACGLSRAAAALIHLDLGLAFRYNAMWPWYLGYILWAIPTVAIPYVKEGKRILLPRPLWLNIFFLAVILIYGILRNFF